MLSEDSAGSPWVGEEIVNWIATKPADRIALVHTDGELHWGDGDWDWTRSTCAPPALAGVYPDEPLWLDLRGYRGAAELDIRANPQFRDDLAALAAPLHGTSKENLVGEDLVQFRRSKRLRRAAVAGLAALTVIAVIAGVAFYFQRQEARRQAKVSTSRQLAATARNLSGTGVHDQALLLAAESFRIGDGQVPRGSPPTVLDRSTEQSFDALLGAVATWPGLTQILSGHEDDVRAAAISGDGRVAATADSGGLIALWDTATGELRDSVRLPAAVPGVRTSSEQPRQLSLDHDGSVVAAIIGPEGKSVWVRDDTGTREMSVLPEDVQPNEFTSGGFENLALSADGSRLIANQVSTSTVWSTGTGERIAGLGGGKQVRLSPDGSMAVIGGEIETTLVDVDTAGDVVTTVFNAERFGAAFTDDGGTVAIVGTPADVPDEMAIPGIWLFDVGRSSFDAQPIDLDEPVSFLSIRADGRRVAAAVGDEDGPQTLTVWELDDFDPPAIATTPMIGAAGTAFTPEGAAVAVAPTSGGALVWDASAVPTPSRLLDAGHAVALSADGGTVVYVEPPDEPTQARIVDVASGAETVIELSDARPAMTVTDGGTRFATFVGTDVVLWTTGAGGETSSVVLGPGDRADVDRGIPYPLSFDPTGRFLAWAVDGSIVVWDVEAGSELRRIDVGFDVPDVVTFDADGDHVAFAGTVWSTTGDGPDRAVAFESPALLLASRSLVVGTRSSFDSRGATSGRLEFVDIDTGALLRETPFVGGQVGALAITPDGAIVASAHSDGTIHFWDRATAAEIGAPFRAAPDSIDVLAFAELDGRLHLVSAGPQGALAWDFEPEAWTDAVCRVAGRNLTSAEWDALVGSGTGYHETCPGLPSSAVTLGGDPDIAASDRPADTTAPDPEVVASDLPADTTPPDDGAGDDGAGDSVPPELPDPATAVDVVVPGNASWTDTGVDVRPGDIVQIGAAGEVASAVGNPPLGPDGDPNPDIRRFNVPGAEGENHAALIGRIGESGRPFRVGASTVLSIDTEGRLFLGINDAGIENNSGEFVAAVIVTRL